MDTKKITSDLLSSGLTQQQLASLVPCSQSTIAAFVSGTRGSNPTYVIATRLLALHAERCGVAATAARDLGHAGRQPPSTANIFDTVPSNAVIVVAGKP